MLGTLKTGMTYGKSYPILELEIMIHDLQMAGLRIESVNRYESSVPWYNSPKLSHEFKIDFGAACSVLTSGVCSWWLRAARDLPLVEPVVQYREMHHFQRTPPKGFKPKRK